MTDIFVVLKTDPYVSSTPILFLFSSLNKAKNYILNEIDELMELQKDTISGLKGEKQLHYEKYEAFLNQYDLLYYYGEYKDYYNVIEPYDIKYVIEKHKLTC